MTMGEKKKVLQTFKDELKLDDLKVPWKLNTEEYREQKTAL